MFKPVSAPRKLSQEVYSILEDAICKQVLAPGSRLNETELAKQLGVSNTPVREALAQLNQEGLIVSVPYQGHMVRVLSDQEVKEIYAVREALEALAAREATTRITKEDLTELYALQERAKEALARGIEDYMAINIEFHDRIVAHAGNFLVKELLGNLRRQITALLHTTARVPGRPERSIAEHLEILEAMDRRDEHLAGERMARHIRWTRQAFQDRSS